MDRHHLPHGGPLASFRKFWVVGAPGDLKEREAHCSQMICGRCWNFVGGIDRTSGQVPNPYFTTWKGLHRRCGHLLTWMKLWRQTLINGQVPRRAGFCMFSFHRMSFRLTLSNPGDLIDPRIKRGGGELLVPPQSLRRATMGSSTFPPPRSKSQTRPKSLETAGPIVSPRGSPTNIQNWCHWLQGGVVRRRDGLTGCRTRPGKFETST